VKVGEEGTIEKANPEFCKMFGVGEEEIVQSKYNLFTDQAIIDGGVILYLNTLFDEKKPTSWTVDFDIDTASQSTETATTKQGKIKLGVRGYPITGENGELLHVVLQHEENTD
jgi:hypothetical protein